MKTIHFSDDFSDFIPQVWKDAVIPPNHYHQTPRNFIDFLFHLRSLIAFQFENLGTFESHFNKEFKEFTTVLRKKKNEIEIEKKMRLSEADDNPQRLSWLKQKEKK